MKSSFTWLAIILPLLFSYMAVADPTTNASLMDVPVQTKLSPKGAIDIAIQVAKKEGLRTERYEAFPSVVFDNGKLIWSIFFTPTSEVSVVGDHFWVKIDDSTRKTRFVPGA